MTVAMYLLPTEEVEPGWRATNPLLLSDTVATIEEVEAPNILPANVTLQTSSISKSVLLFRKSYIFYEHTAIAFAGNVSVIRSVFAEILHQMPNWAKLPRPMDPLTALVNEYRGINIVGATLDPASRTANHIAPHASWTRLGCLEMCAVVGSGRDAVVEHARIFDERTQGAARDRSDRGMHFAAELSAHVLLDEMTGKVAPDWGGYIEWIAVDRETQLWRRQPRTLNLYFEAVRHGGDKASVQLLSRAIAYDPGAPHGRLLVNAPDGVIEYVLRDLMHPVEDPPPSWFSAIGDGWAPEQVVVTVLFPDPVSAKIFLNFRTYEPGGGVICDIAGGTVTTGLSPELLDEIGEMAVRTVWDCTYVR